MESLRVRLLFEDRNILTKSQRSLGLLRSWLLLKPHQHPNFSDVSNHLLRIFDLHNSCPNGLLLSMDGFVLPPFESTCILKDKDIISVKKKGVKLADTIKVGESADSAEELMIVEKQPLQTGVPLLANEEFDKEAGGYESESEEDEDSMPLEGTSGGSALLKKRKPSELPQSSKKKKHRLAGADGVEKGHQKDQIESYHVDGILSRKSPGKKEKSSNAKSKQNIDSSTESAENSSHDQSTPILKSNQLLENDKRNEDISHAPNTTKKLPSRSARRKKAKRQWLRAMAKIGKKDVVCHAKGPLNKKHKRAKTEMKEIVCQPKGLLHWKQSREGPSEKRKEDDTIPIEIRPGHIRFEPLEEVDADGAIQQSQASLETFHWNGITSKRKGQKWGTEKIAHTQRNEHYFVEKNHPDTADIEKEITEKEAIDFDKLLPLPRKPQEDDVIAYRLLELSSTWTPELSSFRVGRVSWFEPESSTVMLVPVPEHPVIHEKLDEDGSAAQPDNSLYREDGSLEIDFASLVDVRVVKRSNLDSDKAPSVEMNKGPPGNKGAVSDLVPSDNVEQKQPNKGNGDVNLWDHLSEALNSKEAEVPVENNWSKWTSGQATYRVWRGGAVGPTVARLRAKRGRGRGRGRG